MSKYQSCEIRIIPKTDCQGNTIWAGMFPAFPGCVGHGNTPDEAMRVAFDNLAFYLERL